MDTSEAAFETEAELEQQEQQREERESATQVKVGNAAMMSGGLQGASEETPLLPGAGEQERRASTESELDFEGFPWYKKPSIYWVLGPFFLMTIAFGGSIAPKLNLILQLVCRQYFTDRQALDPNFTQVPVDFAGGDNDQCRNPDVSAKVAQFMATASFLAGILSAITSPKLGELSDRYGRKPVLMFTAIGSICFEIITIFAAKYPDKFPVQWMYVGFALDGFTGSFIAAMAIANAYASDCIPPHLRNVVFGYFHGCLFTGLAIGPILAGYIVKWTGDIVVVFYIMLGVHIAFVTFIGLFVPESLSQRRMKIARAKHAEERAKMTASDVAVAETKLTLRQFNILEPLKILWPTGPGTSSALRRNLFLLAAVDTIVFGVAMGSMTVIINYTNFQFGWKSFESGRFMSIVSTSRVFCLVVLLPLITRLIRGKVSTRKNRATGSDDFDLGVIRFAVFFDTLGYLGYALARRGDVFIMGGVVAAIGGIASPTLQSSLTKHVPNEQTGQLLGATGLLHSLARVLAPTLFNAVYSLTVKTFTQTVFVCLAATFGMAFVISWFIRPHIYFDQIKNGETASEEDAEEIVVR